MKEITIHRKKLIFERNENTRNIRGMKNILYVVLMFFLLQPLNAQILWEDQFEKPVHFSETQFAHYMNGVYHIHGEQGRLSYVKKTNFKNAAIQVKTEYINGPLSEYGLLFRVQDLDNFYAFTINGKGEYALYRKEKQKYVDLISPTPSGLINKKGINYLAVECKETNIRCYINGQKVADLNDRVFSSGAVGLTAFSGVHVHFDDLLVAGKYSDLPVGFDFTPEPTDTTADYSNNPDDVLIENFSSTGDWSKSDNVYYERGSYVLWNQESGHFAWYPVNIRNFQYEANLKVNRWPEEKSAGYVGIIFRAKNNENYYALKISGKGEVIFERCFDNNITTLRQWQTNADIFKQTYIRLKVQADEENFYCSVNDQDFEPVWDDVLDFNNIGFAVSTNTKLSVLSLRVGKLSFNWSRWVKNFLTSPFFIVPVIVIVMLFIIRRINRHVQFLNRKSKVKKEIISWIKERNGSVRLKDVMLQYGLDEDSARQLMEEICQTYNGQHVMASDGNDLYDFPDYFKS